MKSEKSIVIPVDAKSCLIIEQLVKKAKSFSILTGNENFNCGQFSISKVGIDCGSIPIVN